MTARSTKYATRDADRTRARRDAECPLRRVAWMGPYRPHSVHQGERSRLLQSGHGARSLAGAPTRAGAGGGGRLSDAPKPGARLISMSRASSALDLSPYIMDRLAQ